MGDENLQRLLVQLVNAGAQGRNEGGEHPKSTIPGSYNCNNLPKCKHGETLPWENRGSALSRELWTRKPTELNYSAPRFDRWNSNEK